MPCVASKHAALAAITAAATAKAAVRPLAEKIRKLKEKIARWAELPMTKLLHSGPVTKLVHQLVDLKAEVKELKAGGREQRIAELEAELKKEREARKKDLEDVREAWNSSDFGGVIDYDEVCKAVLAVWLKRQWDENVELRNQMFEQRTALTDLAARIDVLEQPDLAPMADSEPKKIPNPWGRKGKPSSRKIAATAAASPAKKVRTQPARGAVDAAAAVM